MIAIRKIKSLHRSHPGAGEAGSDQACLDHSNDEAAKYRADDRRLAAEDRRAADQHGSDGGQQVALALVAEEVLVLQRQDDRGAGGEKAHQSENLDLFAVNVDADDARDVVRIADEQRMFAEAVTREDKPEKADDKHCPKCLYRNLLKPVDTCRRRKRTPDDPLPYRTVFGAAQRIGLAAREHGRHASPEELRRQRRHEGRNADLGDDDAVKEPDENPRRQACGDRDPAKLIFLEQNREDEARKGNDRGKAEVDFAGADDERQACGEQDQRRQGGKEGRGEM